MTTIKCPGCAASLKLGALPSIPTTHRLSCSVCTRKWQITHKPVPTRFDGVFCHQLQFANISWRH